LGRVKAARRKVKARACETWLDALAAALRAVTPPGAAAWLERRPRTEASRLSRTRLRSWTDRLRPWLEFPTARHAPRLPGHHAIRVWREDCLQECQVWRHVDFGQLILRHPGHGLEVGAGAFALGRR
jgi:hypothetical protein